MILNIGTFNVLATAYLAYGEYSPTTLELLQSERRIPLLFDRINRLNADVLGLQEVEPPLVEALEAIGKWRVEWSPKTMGKPDGCAMLVRPGVDARDYISASYSDASGHVWQQVKIGGVTVVNTHIKWAPEDDPRHIGVAQTRELLRHVTGPAIILGDCNGRPGGRVQELINEAGFTNIWGITPTALVVKDGIAEHAAIDLVAARGIRGETVGELPTVAAIPNLLIPSDHLPVMGRFHFV